MNRTFSFLIALMASSFIFASAQSQPDERDRQKWISEVRNFKHEFLVKDLELSKEQQKDFFAA